MKTGRTSSIGTTAVALTSTAFRENVSDVTVKASPSNSAAIYVGLSTVTANSADATDGYPLEPGESLTVKAVDPAGVYAISTIAGQTAWWAAH